MGQYWPVLQVCSRENLTHNYLQTNKCMDCHFMVQIEQWRFGPLKCCKWPNLKVIHPFQFRVHVLFPQSSWLKHWPEICLDSGKHKNGLQMALTINEHRNSSLATKWWSTYLVVCRSWVKVHIQNFFKERANGGLFFNFQEFKPTIDICMNHTHLG